jgi:hypothetical protein
MWARQTIFKSLIFSLACFAFCAASVCAEPDSKTPVDVKPIVETLSALGHITWWSLDSAGYHPAVLVKIENISGKNLTGLMLRFQARFLDLRYGSVTVGRAEVQQELPNRKIVYVLLKGKQSYELAQDVNDWPVLECKVMCRVGEVEDEGTQTLLITKVDTITMTDEDAFYRINRMPDISPPRESMVSKATIAKSKTQAKKIQ